MAGIGRRPRNHRSAERCPELSGAFGELEIDHLDTEIVESAGIARHGSIVGLTHLQGVLLVRVALAEGTPELGHTDVIEHEEALGNETLEDDEGVQAAASATQVVAARDFAEGSAISVNKYRRWHSHRQPHKRSAKRTKAYRFHPA